MPHLAAATHDYGASLAGFAAAEADEAIFSDHDLVDERAGAQAHIFRGVECGNNVGAENEGEALDAVEVSVLDGHDLRLSSVGV